MGDSAEKADRASPAGSDSRETPVAFFRETRLTGVPLSGGIAVARVCLFNEHRHSNLPQYKVKGAGPDRERARFKQAVAVTQGRLEELQAQVARRIGKAESEIFFAQRMLLEDPALVERVGGLLDREGVTAEAAIAATLDEFEVRLQELDNEYIRERASDFGELKRRMLDVLGNMNPSLQCVGGALCQKEGNRIIVAEELTPGLTVEMDTDHTAGFITERGAANSHAAILARAMGIPAVSGIRHIHSRLLCGVEVLVNGYTGELIVMPQDATVRDVLARHPRSERGVHVVQPVAGMVVNANISTSEEVGAALAMKAEGIGLYRTEFEFFGEGRLLTEDEQYERYAAVVRAMCGKPVTLRLLDLGGDKPAPFLPQRKEENPYLGWRGARFLLSQPDLIRTQARAIVRAAAHGPVRVLHPMVADPEQFLRLRSEFDKGATGLDGSRVKHGVMFEVPAACVRAGDLLAEADFGSIGTNDLIQYLFAVDRNNDLVAHDYRPDAAALWHVISDVAAAARKAGKSMSVCGEVAGDPRFMPRLVAAGIGEVSVSPRMIPGVRLAAAELGEQAGKPAGRRGGGTGRKIKQE